MRTISRSILSLLVLSSYAAADPAAEKSVGVGVGVGVATGPNVQLASQASSRGTQLDIGFGYELNQRMRFQTDYAWRLHDFSASPAVAVPLYLGVGGFLNELPSSNADGGVRMPVGVQADFARAPIQVFGELAPELVLVQSFDRRMAPADVVGMTGLLGVRAAF
jgi:hypothetical protein